MIPVVNILAVVLLLGLILRLHLKKGLLRTPGDGCARHECHFANLHFLSFCVDLPEEIAGGQAGAVADREKRLAMTQRGPWRAMRFSWKNAAKALLDCLAAFSVRRAKAVSRTWRLLQARCRPHRGIEGA